MTKSQALNIVVVLNNIRSSENVGSIFRTADAFGVQKIYLCGYTPSPLDRFGRKNGKLTKASLGAEEFVSWEKVESLGEVVARLRDFSTEHDYECLASLTEASTRNFSAEKYPCIQKRVPEKNIANLKNPQNYVSLLSTDKSLLAFSSARLVSLRKARSENNFEDFLIVGVEQSENSINYRKLKSKIQDSRFKLLALVFGNETEGLLKEDLSLCDMVAEIPMLGKKESLNVAVSVGIVLSEVVK